MRILITGATGFVGRHLVEQLSDEHEVVALVRQTTAHLASAKIRVVENIGPGTDWTGVLEDVDAVVHLAARVHVMEESAADPLAAFRETNTEGTRVLAEEAANQGVKRFVFMSSIKVNGEGTNGNPYTANDVPAPVDPYGISKWEAERALTEISGRTEMGCVILRPTVIYGAGVKGNIARIAKAVRMGIPLPLGLVRNRRSMLSIGNLVAWVREALNSQAVPTNPVLISDPRPVSTRDLVINIADGMGAKPRILPVPVGLMTVGATLIGKRSFAVRLFSDLEVEPTYAAFPRMRYLLVSPEVELRSFGLSMRSGE